MNMQRLCAVAIAACTMACAESATGPDVSIQELRSAPTQLTLNDKPVRINAELWRDMMPSPTPSASALIAAVSFAAGGTSLAMTRVWVVLDGKVWTAPTELVDGSKQWVARGGPAWALGAQTEVVALVRTADGSKHLVRATAVPIQGAY